jgi:hypothetical protein
MHLGTAGNRADFTIAKQTSHRDIWKKFTA